MPGPDQADGGPAQGGGPSPFRTGLKGLCPRCGRGRLFASYLKVADRCNVCGLDFSKENAGDGAIPFIILFVGALGVGLGVLLQVRYDPPYWVLVGVVFPVVIGAVFALMQPLKGLMVALQYRHDAGESSEDRFDGGA